MGTIQNPYSGTLKALADYDAEPSPSRADVVRVAFWLEAPMGARVKHPNPSIDTIRKVTRPLVTA